MIGVNFQPGTQDQMTGGRPTNPNQGVQEAIKVLSLRLPKTVGAHASAPQSLLQSQGGGGSRVDTVVNQVLAKLFPGGGSPSQSMPSFGTTPPAGGPSFSGSVSSPFGPQDSFSGGGQPRPATPPRVVVDLPPYIGQDPGPPKWPGLAGLDGSGVPGGMVGQLPPDFTPPTEQQPKKSPFPEWLGNYGGGGNEPDQPPAI